MSIIQGSTSKPTHSDVDWDITQVLIDFPLIVKVATLIFIHGHGSAISSVKQRKSGSIYNLLKNLQ